MMRYILIGVLVLIGIFGILLLLVALPPGQHYLKIALEKELSGALHQQVTIRLAKTDIFWRIRLQDINIVDNSQPSHPPVFIKNLSLDYRLWRLLFREISVKAVKIDSVNIYLHRDRIRGYNLAFLDTLTQTMAAQTAPTVKKASFRIVLQSAEVDTLSAVYIDEVDSIDARISQGSISLKQFKSPGNYSFNIGLDTLDLTLKSLPLWMRQSTINGVWHDSTLVIDSLKSDLLDLALSISGQYQRGASATIKGDIALSGKPDTLLGAIGKIMRLPPISASGEIALKANVNGTLSAPQASLQLTLPRVTVSNVTVDRGDLLAHLRGDSLCLDSLILAAYDGNLYLNGCAVLDTVMPVQGEATIQDIDLASLANLFTNVRGEGTVNGNISFSGQGKNLENWIAQANLDASHLRYNSNPLGDLKIAGTADSGRVVLNITYPDVDISSGLLLRDGEVNGSFAIDVANLGIAGPIINQPEIGGAIQLFGGISGSIDNPDINGYFIGQDISYRHIPIDSLDGSFQYSNRQFSIFNSEFSGRIDSIVPSSAPLDIDSLSGGFAYRGSAYGPLDSISGQLNLVTLYPAYGRHSLNYCDLDAAISGSRIDLKRANIINGPVLLELAGSYDLKSQDGEGGLKAFALPAPMEYKGLESIKIPSIGLAPAGEVSANFGLTAQTISTTARGEGLDINLLSKLESDTLGLEGILNFDLDFSGTMQRPSGNLLLSVSDFNYHKPAFDIKKKTTCLIRSMPPYL